MAVGCSSGPQSSLSDDVPAAIRQLRSIVPLGTPATVAVSTLQDSGFSVELDHGSSRNASFPDYLRCYYRDRGSIAFGSWNVVVVLVDGKVVDYRISTNVTVP